MKHHRCVPPLRASRAAALLCALFAALFAGACADPETSASEAAAPPEAEPRRIPASGAEASSTATAVPPAPAEGELSPPKPATALVLRPPESWNALPIEGPNIVARYALPAAPGESEGSELLVTYIGPMDGGALLPSLHRWAGLFEQPDGSRTVDRALTTERKIADMPVSEVEIAGTYVGPPDARSPEPKPGWKLLGALVKSPFGPYYFRLLGPATAVDARAGEFRAFLSELE
jgi:hypothetical protein